LLGAAFSGEARGRAIGTWAAAGAIAGAIGPVLGGWLVEAAGWRAIFLINLPLCAGALGLGWRYVAESRREDETPLDWAGVAAGIGSRLPLTIGPIVVAAGFVLLSRAGADASYWTGIAPALLVIAVGLSGAVAPLTTAVMASVDDEHVGTANGFNSAVARTGGLIATALLGSVLAARGEALASAFAAASLVMATAAALSALAALVLLRPVPKPT
jgi:MFS family permease